MTVLKAVLTGLAVGAGVVVFTAAFAAFFDGMAFEAGVALGIGVYLCAVVCVCTALILAALNKK